MKVISPAGMLGTGFPEESLENGLKKDPDFIGVDSRSTDGGPHSLGSGEPGKNVKRDLELLVLAANRKNIPLLVGTAGTAGADPHLESVYQDLLSITGAHDLDLTVAKIHSELNDAYVKQKLEDGKISALDVNVPEMSEQLIDRAEHIVGAMGADPFISAVEQDADVVIAGRSCDSAIFASLALKEGDPPGLAWHLGKILECGN